MFDFTQSAHVAVVHNSLDSTISTCARSSHVSGCCCPQVAHTHRSALMYICDLKDALVFPPQAPPPLDHLFVLVVHRLAFCAKSRHCHSVLLELRIFFDMPRALVLRSFLTRTSHGAHIKQATIS